MTVKTLTAEGAAAGTALVTGGNYGGDNVDLVSITGTGAMTVSSTAGKFARGTRSVRITTAASADTSLFRFTGFDNTRMAVHFTYAPDAVPTANATIGTIRHSSGSALTIQHTATTGKIRIGDFAGTAVWDSTNGYPTTGVPRISVYADRATGTVKVAVYANWSDTTPVAGGSATLTGINLGTTNFVAAQFGKISATYVGSMYMDDVRVDDGATDLLPVESTNTAPTVNAGADQSGVEPWATVTLSATATDPDGTTPTVTWAQTAGSPAVSLAGSGSTRTFEAPGTVPGTTLTFTATASDGSLSATDAVTVAVLPVNERAVVGGVEVPLRVAKAGTAVTNPSVATLTDDFSTKDTAKWSWGAAAAATGGQLILTPNEDYSGEITTTGVYSLTGSGIVVQLVQRTAVGTGKSECYFGLFTTAGDPNDNALIFDVFGGEIYAMRNVAHARTTVALAPFSATNHRWLRLREAAGVIYWDTSPDRGAWSNLGSWTLAGFSIGALRGLLGSGLWEGETGAGTAIFDNLNVAPPADTTAPTVPTGVTATANSPTSVTVSWTASTDAVGVFSYRIMRGGVQVGQTTPGTRTFTDSTVAASTAYSYTVSAVDAAGNRSAESTAATVTTPAATPVVIAADDFNRADSASLGTTPTGGKSYVTMGTVSPQIVGNTLGVTSVTSIAGVVIDAGVTNYTVQAKIAALGSGAAAQQGGLLFRGVDATNWWWLSTRKDASTAGFDIYKNVGGTTTRVTTTATGTPTVGQVLKVVVSGTTYTAFVDGVQIAQVIGDSALSAGTRAGFCFGASGTATRWDDLTITEG